MTFFKSRFFQILISIFSVIVIIVAISGVLGFFFVYIPLKNFSNQVTAIKPEVAKLQAAVSNKDLQDAQNQINNLRSKVNAIEKSLNGFSYAKNLPYVKGYFADGQSIISIAKNGLDTGEILVKAIEPYKDFLGLKGASTDGGKTTQDRITFLTQSIEGLVPHFDNIEKKVADIETSLNSIDPNRYPEEYKGFQIRSNILKAKELVSDGHKFIRDGKPILTKTSWLLGKDKPRNYLLLFQNDAELRPSGGFWTAYGTLSVNNGKISPGTSNNIYDLDDKINSKIPAPRLIKNYHINVPYWYVRDMNLSPDFPTDAKLFLENYYKAYGTKTKIDAIIALDTRVLVDLVSVMGRVETPLGKFTAEPDKRCDGCPQIIYELEWTAGRPRDYIEKDRKGFLGPLMNSMLANAMGSEKSKMAPLAQAAINNINQKHVMFYFLDPEIQKAAVLANIAGAIATPEAGVDYLAINDANMSSAKTNLFLTQKVKHEITVKDGQVEHKVSMTYTNPSKASNCNLEKGDLCLNAPKYRDVFRYYTPVGSKLVKITGSEVDVEPYEELGKTVFEGFYGNKYPLYAMQSLKTTVQYVSSVKASKNYTLMLQKQPGTKAMEYELWVNGRKTDTFSWVADKTIKLSL